MRIPVWRLLALVAAAIVSAPAAALAQGGLPENCRFSSLVPRGEATEVRPGVLRYVLEGEVTVWCDEGGRNPLVVHAERVEFVTRTSGTPTDDESDVGWMLLIGKVTFSQPEITVYAERARIHHKTKLGTFYDAIGFNRTRDTVEKTQFGGGELEFAFKAERIEKLGPSSYEIVGLSVTSCMQPVPRWQIAGSSGAFTLNDHVSVRNAVMRVKGVPVLYLPYFRYPIKREDRSSGLLMPSFGSATVGGYTLSNAFFWAMSRSQDTTFYYDHFTEGPRGLGAEYRYAAAEGSGGNVRLYGLHTPSLLATDGITVDPEKQEYDLRASLSQGLPNGFRLTGNINYFTDAVTQQLFQQNVYAATISTRTIQVDLAGHLGGPRQQYRVHAGFQQTDVFNTLATASRSGYAPRFGVATGRRLGQHLHFRGNVDTAYVLQQSDLSRPDTNLNLWRVDASPTLNAQLFDAGYLRGTASANWRLTYWSDSQDAVTRERLDEPIGRQQVTLRAELVGPNIEGVFQTPDSTSLERIKHVIEPTVAASWASADPSFNNIVQVDAAEAFTSSTIVYGLSNRLLVRRRAPTGSAGPARAGDREILRVDLTQTFYKDARAASFDPNYQMIPGLAPPGKFSPLQLVATSRLMDGVDARIRIDIDSELRRIRTLDASGSFRKESSDRSNAFTVRAGWTKQAEFRGLNPLFPVNSLNATFSARRGRVGGTYAFNVDVLRGVWLWQRIGAYYNAQCCGVTVDYGVADRSHFGAPPSRTFGLTFSLAGVGSFVTPLGMFGR